MKTQSILSQEQIQLSALIDVIALSHSSCSRPIQANLVYATPENFIGRPIDGYTPGVTDLALLTKEAAEALCQVQDELLQTYHYGLLIFDSYRPKRAVRDFMAWSKQPTQSPSELQRKEIHYPHIEKTQLFNLGYLANDSQHCYGNTVDLVLVDRNNNELPLGACFDFMDELSHATATAAEIGEEALRNRHILTETMQKHGFIPYQYEFWHFSFKEKSIHEPIDIEITASLKNLNVSR